MEGTRVLIVNVLFLLLGTVEHWLPALYSGVLVFLMFARSIFGQDEEEKDEQQI
jgi:hypothetical protein